VTIEWLAESRDGELLAGRVGREGDRVIADWPGRARLSATRDGRDVVFEPHPEARPAEVEKLREGAARLLVTHLRGGIPFHASAVSLKGRAVVFIGAAGFGKSTLAATLCEHAGASLLGDDAVAIERAGDSYEVVALRESHWLDASAAGALGRATDSIDDKVPHAPRRVDVSRAPLALIAHLAFSDAIDQPRLVGVSGIEAVSGLLAQLTRFLVDDPEIARRDLGALADLVDRTRIVRLERPRSLDLLRSTADLVAATVDDASPGSP
jgi:hypothetical protein